MTRVGAVSGGAPPPRRAVRGPGFGLPASPPEAAGVASAGSVTPAGLLALQEAGRVEPGSGRARRRTAAALEELRGLQLDLLSGTADPARLVRLAALSEGGPGVTEPELQAVLAEVSLRARLEIARRRAASASTA